MNTKKRVLVVLSGCGFLDGAEIHESVLSLLALDEAGVEYVCAAPDKPLFHVVNHLTAQVALGETRNVLVEAARIARGKIVPLSEVGEADFDAVFLPGGYGAAKNLSSVAFDGPLASVDAEVVRVLKAFHAAKKPIGAVCIAPAVVVRALGLGTVTIGEEEGTAGAIVAMGGQHENCPVEDTVVDRENRLVTAPAYMYGNARISGVYAGIRRAVGALVGLM